jgi:hypothetical protein
MEKETPSNVLINIGKNKERFKKWTDCQ